jgi:hypothetical protein
MGFLAQVWYNPGEFMSRYKVCFYCNSEYAGASKISRRDNKTEICSVCAEFEAVSEFLIQTFQKPTEPILWTLHRLLSVRFEPVS